MFDICWSFFDILWYSELWVKKGALVCVCACSIFLNQPRNQPRNPAYWEVPSGGSSPGELPEIGWYNPKPKWFIMISCDFMPSWTNLDWLVVTPLKNRKVSWDDDIPNIWNVIKFMFQTTNRQRYPPETNWSECRAASSSTMIRPAVFQGALWSHIHQAPLITAH